MCCRGQCTHIVLHDAGNTGPVPPGEQVLSMVAGEFLEVYGKQQGECAWDLRQYASIAVLWNVCLACSHVVVGHVCNVCRCMGCGCVLLFPRYCPKHHRISRGCEADPSSRWISHQLWFVCQCLGPVARGFVAQTLETYSCQHEQVRCCTIGKVVERLIPAMTSPSNFRTRS